jgi:hypothetical protein
LTAVVILKYALCAAILAGVYMAPAWLARQNGKNGYNMLLVRVSGWFFGWTGVGWLWALYLAVRK